MTVPPELLAAVAAEAVRDAGGVPVELLGDFLPAVAAAVERGDPLPPDRLRAYRSLGERAARKGVALRALVDLYLSAGVVAAGQVMLHAADDVVAALTEGFQLARRALVRGQEAARREFIDDLLTGSADVAGLLHRAAGFGLDLAGPHAVAVVAAERPFDDGSPLLGTLERSVLGAKGDAAALLASKDGRLVVVFPAPDRAAVDHVVDRLTRTLRRSAGGRGSVGGWRLGLGRSGPGADGVLASFREAREALELADRLGLDAPVVAARELLVHRMLLRDRAELARLVESTLGGLRAARGGAAPLLATLDAWFATGGNAAATARRLHLSVRAVTYRLARVRDLTGQDPDAPADRLGLQVALLGARVLNWPPASA